VLIRSSYVAVDAFLALRRVVEFLAVDAHGVEMEHVDAVDLAGVLGSMLHHVDHVLAEGRMVLQREGEMSLEEPLAVLGVRETGPSLTEKQDLDHGFAFHRRPCPSSSGVSKRGRGAALDFGA
jgi:hypothetical protein